LKSTVCGGAVPLV